MTGARLIDAATATGLLGVGRATLYAYVSRGQIRAEPDPADPRRRLYHRADVESLHRRKTRGRRPAQVAEAALDWGLPVLDSAVSSIIDGRLVYRGRDAAALARSATLEETARLLWDCGDDPFAAAAPEMPAAWAPVLPALAAWAPLDRAEALLALAPPALPSWHRTPARLLPEAAALVRLVAAAAVGVAPSAEPVHRLLAVAWRLDETAAQLVRAALVLSADHELNASAFTVRCIASTGAALPAAVLGGLAALSGPRHGGMTGRVEALFAALDRDDGDVLRLIEGRVARGERVPGFGHPLYPAGDPRGALLLELAAPDARVAALVRAVADLTGAQPTLDIGLVALARRLGLPDGSAAALFALGRTAGWLGHALEEVAQGRLIRPRARYVGPMP